MRRNLVRGLLYSTLGAALAAGYLVPYKAATTAVGAQGPSGVVLPMLIVAALVNAFLEAGLRVGARWLSASQVAGQPAAAWRWDATTLGVVVLLGGASALGNEAVCRSLVLLNPGLVSVAIRTQVVFVAIGGVLLLREPTGPRFWIGVLLALGGFGLLRLHQGGAGDIALVGVAWALVAAASFGAMQLVIRHAVFRIAHLQVNTLRLFVAAALVALGPGRAADLAQVPARIWILAALAALFGPVLSRLSLMRALRDLPAAHATLALFQAPVFAYVAAGLFFSTWPGLTELLGSTVILAGVALPVLDLARRPPSLSTR